MRLRVVAELALVGFGVSAAPLPGHDNAPFEQSGRVDCEVSEWAYSACEGGRQLRTRYVVRAPSTRGRPCPRLEDTIFCEPVHCDVSEWSAFSPCDATGHRTRTREVTVAPAFGGRACPHLEDRALCQSSECCVSDWSAWACNPNDGVQSRVRRVLNTGRELDPASCPPLVETKPCDALDCVLGDAFEPAGPCDPRSGTQAFRLQVLQPPTYGGRPCAQREEVRACVVDCQVSPFGPWCACDRVTGLRRRSRVEVVAAQNGGARCPALVEEAACARPVDCVCKWSAWTPCWTDGYEYRARWVTVEPERGGRACPPLSKRKQRRPCAALYKTQ